MPSFTFLHAADLHIGSAFRGLIAEAPEFQALFRQWTFAAYDNLIETAIQQRVDFVLIAGDIYDGADRSLHAQLAFQRGLRCLSDAGIQAFVVHGNHDPLDGRISQTEELPGVKVFGEKPQTVTIERAGHPIAAVSGVSFPRRDVRTNLAEGLQPGPANLFCIGLLHANVGSDTGHDPYAPCELPQLREAGMDYWALGHVHKRQVMSKSPHVVYPGNPQGRSVRETGARGCYLVRVDEHGEVEMEFVALDVARWHLLEIAIDDVETIDALEREIDARIQKLRDEGGGRALLCRVILSGRGALYGDLRAENAERDLLASLRERYRDTAPVVWVQRMTVACRPDVDLNKRAQQGDLLAEVLAVGRGYAEADDGGARLVSDVVGALWKNSRAEKWMESLSHDAIRELLDEAQLLCLDLLEDPS